MLSTSSPPFATCHATYLSECECRLLESTLFFGPLTAKVSDKAALSCMVPGRRHSATSPMKGSIYVPNRKDHMHVAADNVNGSEATLGENS